MSADGRKALIGRLVIGNRRCTVTTGVFARIAKAAGSATAAAPFAQQGVTGVGDGSKRSCAPRFVSSGR